MTTVKLDIHLSSSPLVQTIFHLNNNDVPNDVTIRVTLTNRASNDPVLAVPLFMLGSNNVHLRFYNAPIPTRT